MVCESRPHHLEFVVLARSSVHHSELVQVAGQRGRMTGNFWATSHT
jgi:hypothetical protein